MGELNSQIKNIEERYSEYLTTKEGINTKLQDLTSLTSKLNLTLSSNQKRGNWGEIQAEKILEDGGLVKGQHFKTQEILESGGRPDITFQLPNEKILHVDVKSVNLHKSIHSKFTPIFEKNFSRFSIVISIVRSFTSGCI